ncbi:hypothetical protein, partial [Pseudomonas viridiflava]|uniref:hypothetical protein n=1 Tax=Pseudomonas viridiflava TaxID=33069 RepID=UPI00197E3916
FKKPADVSLMDSLQDYPGIEFKSFGRQVVATGSVHPGGQKEVDPEKADYYRWDDFAQTWKTCLISRRYCSTLSAVQPGLTVTHLAEAN